MAKASQGVRLKEEQETVVCIEYFPTKIYVYSSKPSIVRKIKGWLRDYPDEVSLFHEDDYGAEVIVPASWVKIRPVKKRSEAWKEEACKRLKQAKQKQKGD